MKLTILAGIALLGGLATAAAQIQVTDTFNRADTAPPSGGLGGDWSVATGSFYLSGDAARTTNWATDNIALLSSVTLSQSLSLSATFEASATGTNWMGLVFNYTDSSNYDYVRFKIAGAGTGVQMLFYQYVGGTLSQVGSALNIGAGLPINTPLVLTLASTATPGQYAYSLTDGPSGTTSTFTNTAIGGEAGIYFTGAAAMYATSFSVTTVPEPPAAAMLGLACVLAGLGFARTRRVSA